MLIRLLLVSVTPALLHTPVTLTSESTAASSSSVQTMFRVVPVYSTLEGSPLMLMVGAGTEKIMHDHVINNYTE